MAGYWRPYFSPKEGNTKHRTGTIIYSHIFKRKVWGPVSWTSFDKGNVPLFFHAGQFLLSQGFFMAPLGTFLLGGRPKSLEIGHGQKRVVLKWMLVSWVQNSLFQSPCADHAQMCFIMRQTNVFNEDLPSHQAYKEFSGHLWNLINMKVFKVMQKIPAKIKPPFAKIVIELRHISCSSPHPVE